MGRILANTAWLLGGKGFGAICGLAYLTILTRTLGLKDFGHFSLIFATAQAIIALAGIETWRVVVRYGTAYVHERDWGKLGRLGMLCGLIDMAGAIFGCFVAFGLIYGFSGILDLNVDYIDTAFYFCCGMLWALVSAPTGIVRSLQRFDMAVYVEAIVPIGRLSAAILIWVTGPSVGRFLLAWAIIDIIEAILYWGMARKLCPEAITLQNLKRWREAITENPGISRFFFANHFSRVVDAGMHYGPLLIVGAMLGTKAAGLYRLANQLTQAMSKVSSLLTRAVYAEVVHAGATADFKEFRKLVVQTSLIASSASVVIVLLALFVGKDLLILIAGPDFAQGAVILLPLAIAACFELASVAFEPVLHSASKAGRSLIARLLSGITFAATIGSFSQNGIEGAAWSVALASGVGYIALGLMTLHILRKQAEIEKEAPTETL